MTWTRFPGEDWAWPRPRRRADRASTGQVLLTALTVPYRTAAEERGLEFVEGRPARHCRIALDGLTFEAAFPRRAGWRPPRTCIAGAASSTTGSSLTVTWAGHGERQRRSGEPRPGGPAGKPSRNPVGHGPRPARLIVAPIPVSRRTIRPRRGLPGSRLETSERGGSAIAWRGATRVVGVLESRGETGARIEEIARAGRGVAAHRLPRPAALEREIGIPVW